MSNLRKPNKRKRGRPATGSTKVKPSLTIDARLMADAKHAAFKSGMSVSAFMSQALLNHLKKVAP